MTFVPFVLVALCGAAAGAAGMALMAVAREADAECGLCHDVGAWVCVDGVTHMPECRWCICTLGRNYALRDSMRMRGQ